MKLDTPQVRRFEFWFLLILTLITVGLFSNENLDLWAARKFFFPGSEDLWQKQNDPLWLFFYHAAPWLTGILLITSLVVMVLARSREYFKKQRIYAIFTFIMIALGPGLVINSLLKPYWGRPRPREVVELGGHQKYTPFYIPQVGTGGKSFPCGHCSVGFSYGLLYFVFKRRRPKTAIFFFGFSLVFGAMMGVGRIAAGGHFFSDVVAAGLIVYWLCYWLYYKGMNIPRHFELQNQGATTKGAQKASQYFSRHRKLEYSLYWLLGIATIVALLVASPFHDEKKFSKPISDQGSFWSLEKSMVEIISTDSEKSEIEFFIRARGFGFPGSKVIVECDEDSSSCRYTRKGFFSDFESIVQIKIPKAQCHLLKLDLTSSKLVNPEDLSDCPIQIQN